LHYLVGSGTQGGLRGFCQDPVANGQQGPKLVVVPGGERPNFAVTKHEVSWGQFGQYCISTGNCIVVPSEPALPVTGLAVDEIEAYADWLTEQTGFRYRLPTSAEWQLMAVGDVDPNRNCRVEVGGVRRGDAPLAVASGAENPLGLMHVLGNVQELIKTENGYLAVGGSFRHPIDRCVADAQGTAQPEGDDMTGFRLVREVS
jgi:formylglycine-generating enzyme required for sulfatase activity